MPPADPPRASRSKPKRKPKARPQPPSSTARQNAAFGSRPARPLPKPRPYKPTATQVRSASAQQTQYVSQGKATAGAAYRAKPLAERKQIVRGAKRAQRQGGTLSAAQQAALSVHHGRAAGEVAQRKTTGMSVSGARRLAAQGDQYVSQAHAIAAAAKEADRVAAEADKKREAAKPVQVAGISLHVKPSVLKAVVSHAPFARNVVAGVKALDATNKALGSPAETALKNVDRPANALRGEMQRDIQQHGVKEFLIGAPHKAPGKELKDIRQTAKRHVQLKDETSGSDVLKTAGIKNKVVRAVGGFGIDAASAAATLPVGGFGSAAVRAGDTAAARALVKGSRFSRPVRKAVKGAKAAARDRGVLVGAEQGKTAVRVTGRRAERLAARRARAGARSRAAALAERNRKAAIAAREAPSRGATARVVRQAAARTLPKRASRAVGRKVGVRKVKTGQGVGLRYAGMEIPGTRTATAAVGRGVRRAVRKGPAATEAEKQAARGFAQAERSARGGKEQARASAQRVARTALAGLKPDEHQQVIDALSNNDLKRLTPNFKESVAKAREKFPDATPAEIRRQAQKIHAKEHPDEARLHTTAVDLRSAFAHQFKTERQAGVSDVRHPDDFLSQGDRKSLQNAVATQQREVKRSVQSAQRHHERARGVAQRHSAVAEVRHKTTTLPEPKRATGAAPPVPPGHVRLYRGEGVHVRKGEDWPDAPGGAPSQGRWFTEDLGRAKGYASEKGTYRKGYVKYVDVPEHVAKAGRVDDAERSTFVLPDDVASRAGELDPGEAAAAHAEHARREAGMARVPEVTARLNKARAALKGERVPGKLETRVNVKADEALTDLRRHQARRTAAKGIPQKGRGAGVPITETDRAYLKRVSGYAAQHDLPKLHKQAEGLLAKAPDATDVERGYFPREFADRAQRAAGGAEPTPSQGGARAVRTGTARTATPATGGHARTDPRSFDVVQAERVANGEEPFSTNVPLVAGSRVRSGGKAVAESDFARNIASQGRPVTHADQVKEGEKLYALGRRGGKYGLHAARSVPKKSAKAGQHYAIPERTVQAMEEANRPMPAIEAKVFDKITAGWKTATTYTPRFHLRNAYGDIQRLTEMPGNPFATLSKLPGGVKAARAIRQSERYRQGAGAVLKTQPFTKGTMTVAGEKMAARDFVRMLREHKLLDVGRTQQERAEAAIMRGGDPESGPLLRGGLLPSMQGGPFGGKVGRVLSVDTPNAIRATAFKAGLDMGLSPAQAADRAHKFFVDYGKLSAAERQLVRRVFPFYTWTAKSLPVTLANYATHPARYANLNNARNEWNQAITGLNSQQLDEQMKPYTRNNLPVVIPIGGGKFAAVSASWPLNLVQFVPSGIGPKAAVGEAGQIYKLGTGQLNWIAKFIAEATSAGATSAAPGDTGSGINLQTLRPIEDPDSPRVRAPSWAADLPPWAKKELLVDHKKDKLTGQDSVVWRGWASWALRQGSVGLAGQGLQATDTARAGRVNSKAAKIAEFLGVTVEDLGPDIAKAGQQIAKYQRVAYLNKKLQQLPENVNKDNPTPEYLKLRNELNALQRELRPNKPKAGGGIDIGLGGGGQKKVDIGLGKGAGPKVDIGLGG